MKIGYYIKDDLNKEIVKVGKFPRMIDAITTFAQLKNMNTDDFLKLFAVVKLED